MTSGVRAIFDQERVIANFKAEMTCTAIAAVEGVHRSVITKFLKRRGFVIVPSRATGPSKNYSAESRIASARAKIVRARATLAVFGLTE